MLSKDLFNELYSKDLRLFTGISKDMKNHLLELEDKKLLRKRSLIESVFNVLKNHMSLEHSRHRSPVNFLVHVLACLTGYAIKKSTLKLDDLSNSFILNWRFNGLGMNLRVLNIRLHDSQMMLNNIASSIN